MGQSAQTQDMFSVPSGGIADFYMSDEDISAVEREEAQKTFGDEGVAAFEDVAKKMASYGRFGDDRIVHVESGEIVVPRALIEQSPELKESIFSHLREQGVEDPERYVVGSAANSLNPETGLPEFFLSKIAKGVKRAFKGVGKVLKKVAPVVLPIALSMTPLGPVYGAAVGSGIGTLMQGGSLEDAMKNAVLAGGTGAVFKGFTGQGSFGENVSAAFADPGARFQQFGTGLTTDAPLFQSYTPATTTAPGAEVAAEPELLDRMITERGAQPELSSTTAPPQPTTDASFLDRTKNFLMPEKVTLTDALEQMGVDPAKATASQIKVAESMVAEGPGFMRRYGPSVALAGLAAGSAGFFDAPEQEDLGSEFITGVDLLQQDPDRYKLPDEQITYVPDYNPFVPQEPVFRAAEGGVIGSLNQIGQISDQVAAEVRDFVGGGSMSGPFPPIAEQQPMVPSISLGNPNLFPDLSPLGFPRIDPFRQRTRDEGFTTPYSELRGFEEGGVAEVFPRRTGGIMPDEGIAGEDSVRALLMPGEFVMTTDAVKGLGNGDNEQGIRNMYDMMRGLEAKGRAMA